MLLKKSKLPHLKKLLLTGATITLVAIVGQLSKPSTSGAISNFDPGNIISNFVMSNKDSMNVQQIQAFLDSKNPCNNTNVHWAASYPHLHYNIQNGRFVCMAQESFNGESAAQIIWQAAQDFHINPQVLIVLLQKEQGLITDTWPNHIQYQTATGYGCPDTAPCDAQYYGLKNQVRLAASLFRTVLNGGWSNYPVGSVYVQYNPNPDCGGSMVNIQNRATSALYRYTPYQPNAGALAAGFGTAPCGAYGNRNFYLYFKNWFGNPITNYNLVKSPNGGIYQLENGKKRPFPTEAVFLSYGHTWADPRPITQEELDAIPDGEVMPHCLEGRPVSAESSGIYLIENGKKRHFPNQSIFFSYPYGKLTNVIAVDNQTLADLPNGPEMPHYREGRLITTVGHGIYLVEDGKKRPFPSEIAFLSRGYGWHQVLSISKTEIGLIPDGQAMTYNLNFRNGKLITATGGIYLVEDGKKRPFPSEIAFLSRGYGWHQVIMTAKSELDLIPEGAAMTYNTNFRNGQLITTVGHGIYLVEDGKKRPFPDEKTFFSYNYKWAQVLAITNMEFNLIPNGIAMTLAP